MGAAKALGDRAKTQGVDLTTLPSVDTPMVGDWTQVQGVGPTDPLRAVVAQAHPNINFHPFLSQRTRRSYTQTSRALTWTM